MVPLVASGDLWSTKDTSSSSILGSDYLTSLSYSSTPHYTMHSMSQPTNDDQ